jgi:PilZ domain
MSDDSNRSAEDPSEYQGVERRQNERRRDLRFPFTASVDAVEPQSEAKIIGRTSDISSGGCYVDTISPFPIGTNIKIRLSKERVTFEAEAKVVVSQAGMGMGVAFISAMPQQIRIFQKWLNELKGKSSPEPEAPDHIEKDVAQGNLMNEQDYVLGELLVALIRKGVISGDEGKTMLRKLYR